MVNPQKEHGYVGIANEIWDEVIRRNFTKRQKDILMFIWRLSYGCNRKVAHIPKQKDFELCGIRQGHIKAELEHLIDSKVILFDKEQKNYQFNKKYDEWDLSPVSQWDQERFRELLHLNLSQAKKSKKTVRKSEEKVTETGSYEGVNSGKKNYQNSNFSEDENLPKQEVCKNQKLTEKGSLENKNLLKREVGLTEKGSLTLPKRLRGKALRLSKKGLKIKRLKKK
ncbi:replication protein [Paenibacillus senegalensis]|uniref:replication protein n=1 Tax=Paenibacillus senegalensis TaxID=1465766 RepID=UPI000289A613|nr:replication protein [Paenibacillus senegalensis]